MKQIIFNTLIRIPFKYGLIYLFTNTILPKLYCAIFKIDFSKYDFKEMNFFNLILNNDLFHSLIFITLLILILNEYAKIENKNYYGILKIFVLFLVFNSIFKYILSYVFHLLFYQASGYNTNDLTSAVTIFLDPFAKPGFVDPFSEYIINPIKYMLHFYEADEMKALIILIFTNKMFLLLTTFYFYSLSVIFKNYNKNPWISFVPVLNNLTLLEITKKSKFWIILLYIPFLRFIPKYYINKQLANKYKKSNAFVIGMTLIPWNNYGVIAFDKNFIDNEGSVPN